jgi:hypothetical protein
VTVRIAAARRPQKRRAGADERTQTTGKSGTRSRNDGPQSTSKKPKGKPALGREIQAKIGQQLRAYYDALIEPTPDRFADLLRQLDKPGTKEPTE